MARWGTLTQSNLIRYVGTNNYDRTSVGNWNGNFAGDYDWLDDIQINTSGCFNFMPDGGTNIWSYTVPNSTNPCSWDCSGERWLYRINSLKSDFFTDQPIKGVVTNKMTHFTRPSTKDWNGNASQIGIKDIRKVNDYMMVNLFANYWEGEITESMTMSGNPIIGGNLTVASGVALTIAAGTNLTFQNGSSLIVNGTLTVAGISSNKVTFDFVNKSSNGIKISSGGSATITNAIIENAYSGVQIDGSSASATINYCKIEYSTIGVKFMNGATGTVSNTTSKNNIYGIYTSYADPIIQNCIITNNTYGFKLYNSAKF